MSFSEALVYISAIAGWTAIVAFFIQARWPKLDRADLETRALVELALLRDELSAFRLQTLKDRDELRTEVSKHERAFVETTHRVNDCLKETTKLSLAYSSSPVRK